MEDRNCLKIALNQAKESVKQGGFPKVCLINPPTRSPSLRPPHGLMYISSYLSSRGIDNLLIDQKGDIPMDVLVKEVVKDTVKYDPGFVGISCLTTDVKCVFEIADIIKARLPYVKIVLGGIHPTLFPEEMLENENVDFVVVGEGEETFCDLILSGDNADFSSIDGIAFKDNGRIIINKKRRMIPDLDEIPMPAFDKIDMDFYLQPNIHLIRGVPLRGFYLFSSRGCPYRCRFCVNKNIFGRTIRYRSPSKVADEVEYLYKKYRIDAFYLFDDTFAVDRSHAIEFCNEVIKRKLPLVWGCETRVDLINEELVKSLKKASCIQVDLGIESGSERLLELLQKDITVGQVRNAVRLCRKHKIRVFSNFMINLPTETEEDIEKTLSLADEIKSDVSIFNVTCPFPGTDIQAYLKHELTIDDYPKMSSMVSYRTYIDFIESKCKLSSHNIPIEDILKKIGKTVPLPRDIGLKPNFKYMINFLRYFNFLANRAYVACMIRSKEKMSYIRFAFDTVKKRNVSPTKL